MSEQDVPDGPISREEMIDLFGEEMPMEAVKLVWEVPGHMTLREVRQELRRIAKRATQNPRVTQADEERADALDNDLGFLMENERAILLEHLVAHREAAEAAFKTREAALVEALRSLEYWFDTDQEILDAMPEAERADNARQLAKIRTALTKEPDA